jgi:hypothetical protein
LLTAFVGALINAANSRKRARDDYSRRTLIEMAAELEAEADKVDTEEGGRA